jgi:hypothetical protein
MIAVIIYLVYILKGIPLPKCALHNQSYGAIAPPPPQMPTRCRRPEHASMQEHWLHIND